MIPANLLPLANHLWQSTLGVAAAWLLTLMLRKNRAAVRYWIWLAASVKFLVPFSVLVDLGSRFEWRVAPAAAPPSQAPFVMEQIAQPFAAHAASVAPAPIDVPAILLALWFCGFAVIVSFWLRSWWRVR